LEKKGHSPVKHLTGGRLSYLCPLPWHSETKPSFIVWTHADYENFYCFGCQSKHNIIHLVSYLESIPVKKAIEQLADGLEFSIVDEEKLEQEAWMNAVNLIGTQQSKNPTADISKVLIELSDICQTFLKGVGDEPKEHERIDKLWGIVDAHLRDYEFDKIEQIRQEIGPMLRQQRDVLHGKHLNQLKKRYEDK
jgi:hypothetical protein